MDKKLYLVSAALIAILLLLVIIFSVLNSKKKTAVTQNSPSYTPTRQIESQNESRPFFQNQADKQTEETVKEAYLQPESPEFAAREFYQWYVNHSDPLGSGEYKNNPYVSTVFRATLDDFVLMEDYRENDPVLNCTGVTPPKILVPQAATFDSTSQKANVILHEETGQKRLMYRVLLIKENGKWLVKDLYCNF